MTKSWQWHVYILECMDGSYYTGLTWRADLRFDQHVSGLGSRYTREHGVRRLVFLEGHNSYETARIREKQIKGWTRAKKQKLISGEWGSGW